MPLHDWSRIPENVFHAFHSAWIVHLAGALNRGVLPKGYLARPEEYLSSDYVPDVLTLEVEPDAQRPSSPATSLAPVLTINPPQLAVRKGRRIAIFSSRGERRVGVIEIVSPGNKDSAARVRNFRDKIVESVRSGMTAAIIDVLPATELCKNFPGAITRALGAKSEPPVEERHVASFEVSLEPPRVSLYVRPLAIGRALPDDVPLFLGEGQSVPLPLSPSYDVTVEWLPDADRALLTSRPS